MANRQFQFQGDLDGLCGMYSVYNAVRTLFGKDLGNVDLDQIVKEAMDQFQPKAFKDIFYNGMNEVQLESIIRSVKVLLNGYGLEMEIRKEKSMRCDAMLNKMNSIENSVFIIGISGRCEHWTCVASASTECMLLVDSGVMQQLRQSSFKVSDEGGADRVYKVCSEFWVLSKV